jgi:hypothetical protein
MGYGEEIVRGVLLASFVAESVYSFLGLGLAKSKFSPKAALMETGCSMIQIYDSLKAIEEFANNQKEAFRRLKLEIPLSFAKRRSYRRTRLVYQEKEKVWRPKKGADA